ncbi:MAG: hypothetical protein KF901_13320 [Myxococcales bacterium]|nr:hypothetical protein [Myxococcales bacterium]
MTRAAPTALALALAAFAASCGGELTEVFACYSIDPALVGPETIVRLCVTDDEGQRVFGCSDTRLSIAQTGARLSQGIVQDRSERVAFRLQGEIPRPTGGSSSVEQQLIVPFAPGRIVDVSLHLDTRCVERTCEAGRTCVEGACVPIEVNPRCLTDHGALPRPDCDDPRLVAGCSAP